MVCELRLSFILLDSDDLMSSPGKIFLELMMELGTLLLDLSFRWSDVMLKALLLAHKNIQRSREGLTKHFTSFASSSTKPEF